MCQRQVTIDGFSGQACSRVAAIVHPGWAPWGLPSGGADMRRVCGVGGRLLFGAIFCVGTVAAEPVATAAPPGEASSADAADPSARADARSLYDKGKSAAEKGEWEGAYAHLRAAYARYPHPQIAGALGNAAFALKKYPEAIDMLSQNLSESTDLPAPQRADTEKRLADAKARCGTLSIEAPDGAELRVDGASIGKLPLQKAVYLLPGPHTVEVAWPASGAAAGRKQVVEVTAGKSARVQATLGPRPTSSGTPITGPVTAPPAPTTQVPLKPSIAPVVVLGTLAGVGAITGGVLMGLSAAKESEATGQRRSISSDGEHCGTEQCVRLDRLWAERDAFGSAALGVWIGSGVAGLLAATVAIVQSRTQPATGARPQATATTWTPVVSTNGAGFVMLGSF